MTPSPPYAPPVIGPSGLVLSPYSAVLSFLVANYQAIFGSQVYLGNDSSDFQDIAVRTLQASDYQQALQAVYLSFNPLTAIGASLDLLGVLIGTARDIASFSTVTLTLTGTPGATIVNGQVQDVNGNFWNIPGTAIIGSGGTASVEAVAQNTGNITAGIGAITIISTPTIGWTAVTNPAPASPGQPVETDSHYRARLMISQAKPSLSLLAGSNAAVAAVLGVTRSVVYENYFGYTASYGTVNTSGTSVTLEVGYVFDSSMAGQTININGTNYTVASVGSTTTLTLGSSAGSQTGAAFYIGNGICIGPAHSITAVVEGGLGTAIAQSIYDNKNPGVLPNGTTTELVSDPNNGSIELPISYDILGYVIIYVSLNVHGLLGFTSATQSAILTAIVNYLNNLGIGETVVYSQLYWAAASVQPNEEVPLFSIRSISLGQQVASTTASLNATTTIVVASNTGIANGQTVVGIGIPNNTTVTGVSGTNISISAAATATATGVAVSFFVTGTADIPVPYNCAPGGDALNTVVSLV